MRLAIILTLLVGSFKSALLSGFVIDGDLLATLVTRLCHEWNVQHVAIVGTSSEDLDLDLIFEKLEDSLISVQVLGVDKAEELDRGDLVVDLYLALVPVSELRGYANVSREFSQGLWLAPLLSPADFTDLDLRLDSNLFLLNFDAGSDRVGIQELYSVKGGDPMTNSMGVYWPQNESVSLTSVDTWTRRRDLQGTNLVLSALPFSYFAILNISQDGSQILEATGLFQDVIEHLAAELNFTTTHVLPPDMQWGNLNKDGNWDGMVKMLLDREIDICTGGMTITEGRSSVITFSIGLVKDTYTISMKKLTKITFNLTSYIHIFHVVSWGVIAVFVFLMSLGFVLIRKYDLDKFHDDSEEFTVINSIGVVTSALLQKSYPLTINALSSKIIFMTLYLSSFLLFAFYTADLTAMMTTSSPPNEVNTFETIIGDGYKIVTWDKGLLHDLFVTSKSQPYHGIYTKHMESDPESMIQFGQDIGQVLAEHENYAFFGSALYFYNRTDIDKLDVIGSYDTFLALGLQKDSELLPLFDYYLIKMKQSGLLAKLLSGWQQTILHLSTTRNGNLATELGYRSVLLPFIFVLVGAGVGFLTLSTEVMSHCRQGEKKGWGTKTLGKN